MSMNIPQLNDIDRAVVQLMAHAAAALAALSADDPDPPRQTAALRAATDAFLSTLHAVDVGIKRQVLALDEAGIINLSGRALPSGVGDVGSLDVGWLNSRSSRVERDYEAELWQAAAGMLQNRARTT